MIWSVTSEIRFELRTKNYHEIDFHYALYAFHDDDDKIQLKLAFSFFYSSDSYCLIALQISININTRSNLVHSSDV